MDALTPGFLLAWRIHWLFALIGIIGLFALLASMIVKSQKGMYVSKIICVVSLILVLLTLPAANRVRRAVAVGRYWQTFFQNHPKLDEIRQQNQ